MVNSLGRRIWDLGFLPVLLHCTMVMSLGLTFFLCKIRILNVMIVRLYPRRCAMNVDVNLCVE